MRSAEKSLRKNVQTQALDEGGSRSTVDSFKQHVAQLSPDDQVRALTPPVPLQYKSNEGGFTQAGAASATSASKASAPSDVVQGLFKTDEGLHDLPGSPPFKGEVAIPGAIKNKGKVYRGLTQRGEDDVLFTAPAEGACNIHDIGEKSYFWVQIPGDVVYRLNQGEDAKKFEKKETEKRAKDASQEDLKAVGSVIGLVSSGHVKARTKLRHNTYGKRTDIFEGKTPGPEDINQKALGDCYFLAALSAVARHQPAKISELITDNTNGTVTARFYRVTEGETKTFAAETVTVRKSLVHWKHWLGLGGQAFQKGPHWVGLVVKAYAAWGGHRRGELEGYQKGYAGVGGGHSSKAWEHILGQSAAKKKLVQSDPFKVEGGIRSQEDLTSYQGQHERGEKLLLPWSRQFWADRGLALTGGETLASLATEYNRPIEAIRAATRTKYERDPKRVRLINSLTNTEIVKDARIDESGYEGTKLFMVKIPPGGWLKACIPELSEGDLQLWLTYAAANIGKLDKSFEKARSVGKIKTTAVPLSFIKNVAKKANLSEAGQAAFVGYCGNIFDTKTVVMDTSYSKLSKRLFMDIYNALIAGKYIGASTPKYGKAGGSSGEDTETVVGIAGGHAYEVVDTEPSAFVDGAVTVPNLGDLPDAGDRGKYYIVLRNPWGRGSKGRTYDRALKAISRNLGRGKVRVELSDFRRYISYISYTETYTH